MRRILAAVVLLLLAPAAGFALDPSRSLSAYVRTVYDEDDGLQLSNISAVTQDRAGFLWIATQEGVARFDGLDFVTYDKRSVPAMVDHDARAIVSAPDGIWVGTGEGVLRHDSRGWKRWGTADGLPEETIQALAVDTSGVWAGTRGGLARVSGNGKVSSWGVAEGLPHTSVSSVAAGANGALWVGGPRGVARFVNGTFRPFTSADGLPSDVVTVVHVGPTGKVWVGTGGGVALLEGERFRSWTSANGLAGNAVRALHEDGSGTLWIGTESGGLQRLRKIRWEKPGTSADVERLAGGDLFRAEVTVLRSDIEGSLWVGTLNRGLWQLRDPVLSKAGGDALDDSPVASVLEDRMGALWVATRQDGVARWSAGVLTWLTQREGLPGNAARSLLEDRAGDIWVGTDAGIARVRGGKVVSTFGPREGLNGNAVYCLHQDSHGTIRAGLRLGGVVRLDEKGTRFDREEALRGLADDSAFVLHEDRAGTLWIGTLGTGLVRLAGGAMKRIRTSDGLADDRVRTLHEDREGTIWIASEGGLTRFKSGTFAALHADLPTGSQFLEDDAGNFWIGENKGIHRVAKSAIDAALEGRAAVVPFSTYGRRDGMLSAECNGHGQPTGTRGRDGRIWFSTMRGAIAVDPAAVGEKRAAPRPALDGANADGEPVAFASGIDVPYDTRRLEIAFTAPTFVAPELLRFWYRLDPTDPTWVDSGPEREAQYLRLAPGRYRLEMRACMQDGGCSESEPVVVRVAGRPVARTAATLAGALALAAVGALVSRRFFRAG